MKKGESVQDFTLTGTNGRQVMFSDVQDNQTTVLLFFPLAFSSVCTEELCTVKDSIKLYKALNAKIIAISVDSFFSLREFKRANNLPFTLLSDFNKEVSEQFGVLNNDYFGMKGVSKRAVFVIKPDKTVCYAEILEDSDSLPDFIAIQKALKG